MYVQCEGGKKKMGRRMLTCEENDGSCFGAFDFLDDDAGVKCLVSESNGDTILFDALKLIRLLGHFGGFNQSTA